MTELSVPTPVRIRGQKIGSGLIVDAAQRALKSELMVSLMAVDAKDEDAARFYLHHGFWRDQDNPNSLFIPLKRIAQTLVSAK